MTRAPRIALVAVAIALVAVAARAQFPEIANRTTVVPAPPQAMVKITITTVPPQKRVFVSWGKKKLGVIAPKAPLILQRPRDSGPLDLLIQCEGFVTVQTRAYTFADNKLVVKLTPLDQKSTILGYRSALPPEVPDGGVVPPPPPLPGAPPALPPGIAAPRPDAGAR